MAVNKPSSTTIAVIGGLVVGHALFSLRYPEAWPLGVVGLVLVVAVYIAISKRTSSSAPVDEDVKASGTEIQEPIDKEKAREKHFIKVTF